jgi:hypothetical protein
MKTVTKQRIGQIVNQHVDCDWRHLELAEGANKLRDALEAKERECEQLKNEAIEHYKNCSAFPRNLSEEAFRLLESVGADKGPHGNTLAGMIQNVCEATEQLRRDKERLLNSITEPLYALRLAIAHYNHFIKGLGDVGKQVDQSQMNMVRFAADDLQRMWSEAGGSHPGIPPAAMAKGEGKV